MKREKPRVPIVPIATLEDADAALAEIAEIDRAVEAAVAQLNADIDALKANTAEETAPLLERKEALGCGLANFATLHKNDLFREKRSIDRPFGRIGWRRSTALALLKGAARTWKEVLGRLRQYEFRDGIRTKEEVDKEALSAWPGERLELVGVARVERDEFYYEIKREELEGE